MTVEITSCRTGGIELVRECARYSLKASMHSMRGESRKRDEWKKVLGFTGCSSAIGAMSSTLNEAGQLRKGDGTQATGPLHNEKDAFKTSVQLEDKHARPLSLDYKLASHEGDRNQEIARSHKRLQAFATATIHEARSIASLLSDARSHIVGSQYPLPTQRC